MESFTKNNREEFGKVKDNAESGSKRALRYVDMCRTCVFKIRDNEEACMHTSFCEVADTVLILPQLVFGARRLREKAAGTVFPLKGLTGAPRDCMVSACCAIFAGE